MKVINFSQTWIYILLIAALHSGPSLDASESGEGAHWLSAQSFSAGGGWWGEPGFGYYWTESQSPDSWLFHAEHGWLWATGSLDEVLWFYAAGKGEWALTTSGFYPRFWTLDTGNTGTERWRMRHRGNSVLDESLFVPVTDSALLMEGSYRSVRQVGAPYDEFTDGHRFIMFFFDGDILYFESGDHHEMAEYEVIIDEEGRFWMPGNWAEPDDLLLRNPYSRQILVFGEKYDLLRRRN